MATVETELGDDRVLIANLHRGKANAIAPELLDELEAVVARAEDDEAVGALLLGSAAPRFFSGGLDVPQLLELERPAFTAFFERFCRVVLRIVALPKPVVGAIPGHAMAGGLILALAPDWRIVTDGKARFGVNEVDLGVPLPDAAVELFRLRLGPRRTAELALRCLTIPAAEIADEVVPEAEVAARARALAAELAGKPRDAMARTKAQINGPSIAAMERAIQDGTEPFVEAWYGDEAQRRLRALIASLAGKRTG